MGCFLGCFSGAKDAKRRKHRVNRGSPKSQRDRVLNVQQRQGVIHAEQSITETTPPTGIPIPNLVPELREKAEGQKQSNLSPKKRVTFDSNVTTYAPVSIYDITDSLPENNRSVEKEQNEDSESPQSHQSQSESGSSVTSSSGLFPPNHRYHKVADSDDEIEEYGDSDLDDLDEEDESDYSDEDADDDGIACEEVWSESVLNASMESRIDEAESPLILSGLPEKEVEVFGPKPNARDRSDYVNSVLNPVENTAQWKAAKSKVAKPLKGQKENMIAAELEAPRLSFSHFEPTFKHSSHVPKANLDQPKNEVKEIAVDSSLSSWLVSPDTTTPAQNNSFNDRETPTSEKNMSQGSVSPRSFDDRPILGALTVEELKQMSASSSPRKSPGRNPDEMPIIGTVGTYWNNSGPTNSASSFKGIPNTTSKYREDKRVNWHTTPFETRLERALNRGAAEA